MSRPRFFSVAKLAVFVCWALVLSSCGGGGDGGGNGGAVPRFVVATHGSADFSSDEFCPGYLDFSVFLEDGGSGWVSLENDAFGAEVVEVTWTLENAAYVVSAPEVLVPYDYDYDNGIYVDAGWRDLSLRIEDADRDGSAESGEASATLICQWEQALSVHTDEEDVTFDVAPESEPATVGFAASDGLEPIYTFNDAIDVLASKALLAETLQGIELQVNGAPVAATIAPLAQAGPVARGFVIDPLEPLPFDADLTIAPGTAADPFGVRAVFDGEALHTVEDPGPLSANPSFDGEGGWIGLSTQASDGDFPIVDGPQHAIVTRDLVGYFDVPQDAVSLSVEVGVENYYDTCSYASADLWMDTPAGPVSLYPDIPDDAACSDFPYGCLIPWSTTAVSLESLRGQRVVLRAIPARYTTCRPDVYDYLHLDDIRIEQ